MIISFDSIMRLVSTLLLSLILTPIVRLIAFKIGAVDYPGERRINKDPMPTAGGLAIYFSFAFSIIVLFPNVFFRDGQFSTYTLAILGAGLVVVLTGLIDDIKELSPKQKTLGITLAALMIYFFTDIHFDSLNLFGHHFNFEWFSLPLTVLWILAITNAINLIDGLDGLASGVSIISLTTLGVIGYFFLSSETAAHVPIMIFILVAATCGFFPYNFHPAKIFLGDTGALFLGFMISILSLQGLKNATFITLLTPLVILGVPITDTVFAMIRRKINKQPISSADKMHLHHRLLSLGFTHRGAVMTIYCLALVFSFIALLYNYTTRIGTALLTLALLLGIELFVELIGLAGAKHQPLMYLLHYYADKDFRKTERKRRALKKAEKEQHEKKHSKKH